eukprot:2642004-Rhodomonas_salina.1
MLDRCLCTLPRNPGEAVCRRGFCGQPGDQETAGVPFDTVRECRKGDETTLPPRKLAGPQCPPELIAVTA